MPSAQTSFTANQLLYGAGTSPLATSANLTFDGTVSSLTVNGIRLLSVGTHNQFVGSSSGNTTLSGSFNLGIGETSLSAITSGQFNVGLGYEAGKSLQSGSNNMAIGTDALFSCVSGGSNVAIGTSALFKTTANNNVAIGTNALSNVVAGASNVAIGFAAAVNTTGSQAVCIGTSAGENNDSNSGDNVNIGYRAGQGTAGNFIYQNVFIGIDAGRTITSAHDTTAIGAFAAATLTSGISNTIIGSGADVTAGAAANRIVIGKGASGDTDNQVFLGDANITALVPGADNVADLGRAARKFKNGYFGGVVSTGGYTVAGLPAGTVGQRAYVTNALAPVFLSTVVGGGAVTCPVFYNGTNWIVG